MRKIKIFSCNFAERKIITKKNNNMKTVLNIVLAAIAVFLLYICYESVMGPVRFEEEKNFRDKVVQARLLDIRKAQAEYSNTHDRQYTDNFDSLIYFVKNQKLPLVFKKGVLSDAQLENGLTEAKAMAIINKAKKRIFSHPNSFRISKNIWIMAFTMLHHSVSDVRVEGSSSSGLRLHFLATNLMYASVLFPFSLGGHQREMICLSVRHLHLWR